MALDDTKMESKSESGCGEALDLSAVLLRDKMIGALEQMGYSEDDQNKVATLIARNTKTVYSHKSQYRSVEHEIEETQSLLPELLSRFASFNTNEPVLIISLSNPLSRAENEVEMLVNEVCQQLRTEYNVKPVRIAVVDQGSTDIDASTDPQLADPAFSLTLVNVVNTDIGGPSMIQLFDDDYSPTSWLKSVIWIEAWNNGDHLWKRSFRADFRVGQSCAVPLSPSESDTSSNGSDMAASSPPEDLSQPKHDFTLPDAHVPDARPPVDHPTWQHTNASEGLIDLVTFQASQTPVVSDDKKTVTPAARDKPTSTTGEEDFEIV